MPPTFSVLAATAAAVGACATGANPHPRPNVVFVLVDDLRWDALSSTGHPWSSVAGCAWCLR